MPDLMKLTDGTSTVFFSPGEGYQETHEINRVVHKSLDNTVFVYTFGSCRKYEIPITHMEYSDAHTINNWWQTGTELTFYPDLKNTPYSIVTVTILNEIAPMQMKMTGSPWRNIYEGTLILIERKGA